jgi:uncharacterized protein (TIGR03067 family)
MLQRSFACLVLAILMVNLAFSGEGKPDDAKNIQGTWSVVSFTGGGESSPKKDFSKAKMKITKDQLIMIVDGKEQPVGYRLNPKAKPKEIDLLSKQKISTKEGDKIKLVEVEDRILGLYQLKGDDLQICIRAGKPRPVHKDKTPELKVDPPTRPTELKGTDDTVLIVLKRDK